MEKKQHNLGKERRLEQVRQEECGNKRKGQKEQGYRERFVALKERRI